MVDVTHEDDEPNGAPCNDNAPEERGKHPRNPNVLAKWIVDQATKDGSNEDEGSKPQN